MAERIAQYAPVRLTADLSHLSGNQRRMLRHLLRAAGAMDRAFQRQAYGGDPAALPADPAVQRYVQINYGPWDRLDGNQPFVAGVGEKPKGATFYPVDMTVAEFDAHLAAHPEDAEAFKSQYTVIRRNAGGGLVAVPYHEAYEDTISAAAVELEAAAQLAESPSFRRYLLARAEALRTSAYRESDRAWLDMTDNAVDFVVGPIETYEDQLFGYKAAFEAYLLLKDQAWSARLSHYARLLPDLQRGLPGDARYRQEMPGTDAQLNAYDVVFYAGDCNAGSKTIAINLPNDEVVQLEKGTRRLQLKNAMRAKYDQILVPIAEQLLVPEQRKHVTFDAFFANTMFHEVAHGLGIKNTINGRGTVREALRDQASALEEGKADILGLYMVTALHDQGTLTDGCLEDYYVTFMTSIFRSVRFGAASAHGRANMLRFNFFEDHGAFVRLSDGRYRVDIDRMRSAMAALGALILQIQGDGDYDAATRLMATQGGVSEQLQKDLNRLSEAGIAVDVVFEQGAAVLGV